MKLYRTFIYMGLSAAAASPMLSHAQVTLPEWLQPTWIKAKFTDAPAKTPDRYEVTQANAAPMTGTTNLQTNSHISPQVNPQTNQQLNQQMLQPPYKQSVILAPVETAVPKMNEKYLTAEELKELRKQLRQQR